MNGLFELIADVGVSGLLDIVVMWILIYSVLVWFKKTRAAFVVTGMLITGGMYVVARQLNLSLTTSVFQAFFAIVLIATVVIFQEEIKHFFEQIATRSALRKLRRGKPVYIPRNEIEVLVRTLIACAQDKIGTLIVVRGKDPILRHIEPGEDVNGEMSEPLLRSIFDPHSIGHDGAVLIEGGTITHFACHLPLSKNLQKVQNSGTRHAAALGLAELTDALCLVVSEERGAISYARRGVITEVAGADELTAVLEAFYDEVYPSAGRKPLREFFRRNNREKVLALGITVLLWVLLVQGSRPHFETYRIPIMTSGIPDSVRVAAIEPYEVDLVFSGPERSFYFLREGQIRVSVRLFGASSGTTTRTITRANVVFPDGLTLENIEPDAITLTLEPTHP